MSTGKSEEGLPRNTTELRKLPRPQENDPNCAEAAANLLNCVASKDYSIDKCKVYIEVLRACVKKEVRSE